MSIDVDIKIITTGFDILRIVDGEAQKTDVQWAGSTGPRRADTNARHNF